MSKERILITVKTYPTLSTKYGETVCTAGIREDGTWVRLYPVPFRRLNEDDRYKLFDWIECRLQRNTSDPRPETFRPLDQSEMRGIDHVGTSQNWFERRRLLLDNVRVFDRLADVIDAAKANEMSLAVFKPTKIEEFVCEKDTPHWDEEKLEQLRSMTSQNDLFDDNTWRKTFKAIPKLPFSFSYRFRDVDGKSSTLQILEWQLGQLYWNCLKSAKGDEKTALARVRQKYFDEFLGMDLHFFIGTTQQFHFVAPNPWVIVGVFPIPHEKQSDLF